MVILDCGGEEWECVFLVRPGQANAGLSGGWRGFAIDQRCVWSGGGGALRRVMRGCLSVHVACGGSALT